MVHSHEHSQRLATAHFDHIEVTHAGQAFRLGRYPIHFHLEGDVHGSYVKGCAIHRSFNRAVTMHGVHNLVVERNVIYDILGRVFCIYLKIYIFLETENLKIGKLWCSWKGNLNSFCSLSLDYCDILKIKTSKLVYK